MLQVFKCTACFTLARQVNQHRSLRVVEAIQGLLRENLTLPVTVFTDRNLGSTMELWDLHGGQSFGAVTAAHGGVCTGTTRG